MYMGRTRTEEMHGAMAKIEIYTSPWCGYCLMAKKLLKKKGAEYVEFDVTSEPGKRAEMAQRAGGLRTVPQIFIDGQHVGGCNELYDLDRDGKLDPMLGEAA